MNTNNNTTDLSHLDELDLAFDILEVTFPASTGERLHSTRQRLRRLEAEIRRLIECMEEEPELFERLGERLREAGEELRALRALERELEANLLWLN
jgi:hypothetical protein